MTRRNRIAIAERAAAGAHRGGTGRRAQIDVRTGDGTEQLPAVKSTVYSFGGDVAAFYEWLQLPAPGQGDETDAVAQARLFLIQVAG
jgi:hypothetical protein